MPHSLRGNNRHKKASKLFNELQDLVEFSICSGASREKQAHLKDLNRFHYFDLHFIELSNK